MTKSGTVLKHQRKGPKTFVAWLKSRWDWKRWEPEMITRMAAAWDAGKAQYAPGGPTAKDMGCLCPKMDNGHGRGRGDGTYVRNPDCPLHKGWVWK